MGRIHLFHIPATQAIREIAMPEGPLLDLALGVDFRINGNHLPMGTFQFSEHPGGSRSFQSKKNKSGFLISILLDGKEKPDHGTIYCNAYYFILELLSKGPESDQSEILLSLLIQDLIAPDIIKESPIPFQALQRVFLYLKEIENMDGAEIKNVPVKPLDKKRFQLGCQFLYQKSFKKILQDRRLNLAMESLLHYPEPFYQIHENAGYQHGPSFKKAFKKKFKILPDAGF